MKEASEPSAADDLLADDNATQEKQAEQKEKEKERKRSVKDDPFAKYGDIYSHSWPRDSKDTEGAPQPQQSQTKTSQSGKGKETATQQARKDEPPDIIEIGEEHGGSSRGTTTLVKVNDEDPFTSGGHGEDDQTKASKRSIRKAKRTIKIMESPSVAGGAPGATASFDAPTPSKPTKYYKPPRASGKSALDGGGSPSSHRAQDASGSGYHNYAGSSSPATFKGILRGMARLLTGSDEDLSYYKANYSATGHSPDMRSAKESSRKADRRAGRTTDLYTDENKKHWRMQCQLRAQERDIHYVKDMRVCYVSEVKDQARDPIVVAIGAHYSKRMIPREDMVLHITKEVGLSKVNEKPYSVVYCHSNVDHLPKKPAVGFFKSLHAALAGEVCSNSIKAIYVVHPSPLLRTWILSFQIRVDPHLFKKVVYVHSLRELDALMHGHNVGTSSAFADELPPHVHEFERNRNK